MKKSDHIFFHNSEDAKYFANNIKKQNFSVIGGSGINLKTTKLVDRSYLFKEKLPKIACFARLLKDKGYIRIYRSNKNII